MTDQQIHKTSALFARGIMSAYNNNDKYANTYVLKQIDLRNEKEKNPQICHSHDFCDANVAMLAAVKEVIGGVGSEDILLSDTPARRLWEAAWAYTKRMSFNRMGAVRGVADTPVENVTHVTSDFNEVSFKVPGVNAAAQRNIAVAADWWGRDPHFQLLCFSDGQGAADSDADAPSVVVRYDKQGRVCEVLIDSEDVVVRQGLPVDSNETPWEIARDANPVCEAGDLLKMPSGLVVEVMSLRDRYSGSLASLCACDEAFNIVARCCPGCDTAADAWEMNPLTAGTTDPADLSYVPSSDPTVVRWAIFVDTLCGGREPVGRETTEDGKECWLLFDTEKEAQLDIVDDLKEHIRQFEAGERDYDSIDMPPSCYAQKVAVYPSGDIKCLCDGGVWRSPENEKQ